MQIVETLNEGLKRAYTLTVTAKDIDARVEEEVKSIAPQVRMPGFRPGKVPANLVRKMHGPALQREALDKSIREGVEKVIAENKLRPAMQPSVELTADYEDGKDAEVKVALEILPEVPAPKIEGIKLERLVVDVTDEQIDEAVGRLAAQSQRYEDAPKSAKAKEGDQVVMDFVGKVDGVAFEGGTGSDMAIAIGSGNLIPGFEDQLVGVKAGDEKTINVTFPAEYGSKELAGKDATFDLVIKAVKNPVEKPADDEFAKQLGLESLEKLRELFKAQIEQEHGNLTRTYMKRQLLDQLAAGHDFEVPPGMVEAEFGQIWQQLEHEAGHEEDPAAALKEMEADRDDYRKIAERRVRLGLLLSEIGQANGVEITQAEMNRLVAQAAQQYAPQDRERFVEYVRNEPMAAAQLRAPLYEDKVVDYLFEKADVSERTVARADLEAAIESEEGGHVHGPDCGHDHSHDAKPAKKAAAKKPAAKKADAEAEAAPAEEAKAPAKKAPAKKAAAAKADEGDAAEKPAKKPAAKKAKAAEA
ncbi:trigger factor [Sphingobium sp. B2D3A]|uniref:trigger factor n=1 Tax=unclassified Sphingobium TaxID=2611147 RepID=UPI00222505CD|nr:MULTISPECIES: trigger factor [unclassified Sphingobium]MCW2337601.1 trigger factor [Sphingobium sp. B2D3A]MCW2384059.1 trigger factor [Sphingobium sp. B2D3D]